MRQGQELETEFYQALAEHIGCAQHELKVRKQQDEISFRTAVYYVLNNLVSVSCRNFVIESSHNNILHIHRREELETLWYEVQIQLDNEDGAKTP